VAGTATAQEPSAYRNPGTYSRDSKTCARWRRNRRREKEKKGRRNVKGVNQKVHGCPPRCLRALSGATAPRSSRGPVCSWLSVACALDSAHAAGSSDGSAGPRLYRGSNLPSRTAFTSSPRPEFPHGIRLGTQECPGKTEKRLSCTGRPSIPAVGRSGIRSDRYTTPVERPEAHAASGPPRTFTLD